MQKMHKCDNDGEDGGDFSTTVVATVVGKCKRKRTATLGSTGREERGVTARLANFQRTQVSLTPATDLASVSSRNTSTRGWFGLPGMPV